MTLIEIMVVLLLLGMAAAISLPNLHQFLRQRGRASAVGVAVLFRRAQGLAAADPTLLTRVRFLPEQGLLQVEQQRGEQWVAASDDEGNAAHYRYPLASEPGPRSAVWLVAATDLQGARLEPADWRLYQWPDGSRDPARLVVADGTGGRLTITVPRLLGAVTVTPGE